MTPQGKGKSVKEILKRIDYFGSLSLTLSVRFYAPFVPFNVQSQSALRLLQFWYFWACVTTKVFRQVSLQPHINPVLTHIQWSNLAVIISITLACILAILFLIVEFFFAPEPVLSPSLLKQKIPLLVGASNILVPMCNFSIMYFFPMWFQTVILTNASTAGMRMIFLLFYIVNPTKIKI